MTGDHKLLKQVAIASERWQQVLFQITCLCGNGQYDWSVKQEHLTHLDQISRHRHLWHQDIDISRTETKKVKNWFSVKYLWPLHKKLNTQQPSNIYSQTNRYWYTDSQTGTTIWYANRMALCTMPNVSIQVFTKVNWKLAWHVYQVVSQNKYSTLNYVLACPTWLFTQLYVTGNGS